MITVTEAPPGLAMSVAGMKAVSCPELTKVVVRLELFHCTIEPTWKSEPFTVSVNPGRPAVIALGDNPIPTGMGAWPFKLS